MTQRLPFAVQTGEGLGRMLQNLPPSVDRSQFKPVYRPVKDTVLLANTNVEAKFFTSSAFAGGTEKNKFQHNLVNPGKGIFGDVDAVICGARIVLPRFLADGTTYLTLTNADNLLRAYCELRIDGKPIFYCEAEDLPQGQGIYYQASEVSQGAGAAITTPALTSYTNGVPSADNRFIFEEPEIYGSNEKIELNLTYPASGGVVLTANAHLISKLDAFTLENLR